MPYMMDPGEELIVADAINAAMKSVIVTNGEYIRKPDVFAGEWNVTIKYLRGEGHQHFTLNAGC